MDVYSRKYPVIHAAHNKIIIAVENSILS